MRRYSIFLILVMTFVVQWSLFAGGNRETPTRHNIYGSIGQSISNEVSFFNQGAGYEGAIGKSFSLGGYLGFLTTDGWELLLKPRFYFGQSSLENFFIGANLGYSSISYNNNNNYDPYYDPYYSYYDNSDYGEEGGFVAGLNIGYKFVFGSNSTGFSLEPSIGYDFLPGRINIGLALGFAFGGNARAEPAPQPAVIPSAVKDGIYIGIIVFGPDAEDITGGNPVYLDQQGQGMTSLNRLLDTKYQRTTSIGTALFYSAHLALANMKKAESKIPKNDLANVTLFTFTDGLDVSSTGLSLPAITDPGNVNRLEFAGGPIRPYMDFVKGQIDNRKINGTPISAHIVAVQGDDITDVTAFRGALRSLATNDTPKYVRDDIDMSRLNVVFQEIASGIVNSWTQTSFTMITPEYANGTRVRMTFGPENAQNARFYIDGEVTVRNRQYYLTNINYGGGINSSVLQGGEIRGEIKNRSVHYNFPQFAGYNLNNATIRQWLITAGNNVWQINSEYNSAGASQLNVEKHNAFIYLVLDRSSSIAPADVPKVQQAAKDFIKILQDVYWRN